MVRSQARSGPSGHIELLKGNRVRRKVRAGLAVVSDGVVFDAKEVTS